MSADPASTTEHGRLVLTLGNRELDLAHRVAIMGIVNRTVDSFWDGGEYLDLEDALDRAALCERQGADIIDVGAVSARQGPAPTVDQEAELIVSFVSALRSRSDVAISVDTYRSEVANGALDAGANMINDVTGASDPEMLEVVADHGAAYVVVHGGPPKTYPFRLGYRPDVTTKAFEHCRALIERALNSGITRDHLVVDPGHDLLKTTYHSLELTRNLDRFTALGVPILVAASNKSFVGEAIGVPKAKRPLGNEAVHTLSICKGARILRVHDVERAVATSRMTEVLLTWTSPATPVRGLQ